MKSEDVQSLQRCGDWRYLTRFAGSKNWLYPDYYKVVRFACLLPVRNFLRAMQDAMQRRTGFLAANLDCDSDRGKQATVISLKYLMYASH